MCGGRKERRERVGMAREARSIDKTQIKTGKRFDSNHSLRIHTAADILASRY
jgi:hypothetical protein